MSSLLGNKKSITTYPPAEMIRVTAALGCTEIERGSNEGGILLGVESALNACVSENTKFLLDLIIIKL